MIIDGPNESWSSSRDGVTPHEPIDYHSSIWENKISKLGPMQWWLAVLGHLFFFDTQHGKQRLVLTLEKTPKKKSLVPQKKNK